MGVRLEDILESRRNAFANSEPRWEEAVEFCVDIPAPRDVAAVFKPGDAQVIAEIKRRSPTHGDLCKGVFAGPTAKWFERAGASIISVLTEDKFFGGSSSDLRHAFSATNSVPLLKKDFVVSRTQIFDARLTGASMILLIARAQFPHELTELVADCQSIGLTPLVEVHDPDEVSIALDAGATYVGVNCRDLDTLNESYSTHRELIGRIPDGVVPIAESGIRTPEQVAVLRDMGYQGVLIGATFMHAMSKSIPTAIRSIRAFSLAGTGPRNVNFWRLADQQLIEEEANDDLGFGV